MLFNAEIGTYETYNLYFSVCADKRNIIFHFIFPLLNGLHECVVS